MRYIIISVLIFFSAECFSQAIGGFIAPNNIAVLGMDTAGNSIGKGGRIYVLKPTNVTAPLSLTNDSSIGWSGTQGDILYFSASGTLSRLAKSTTAGDVLTNGGSSNNPAWGAPTSSGWSLTGNSGTTASNWLGTNDNTPLRFRVNNATAARIDTTPKYTVSFGTLSIPDAYTGLRNSAYGSQALHALTSGNNNTAIGVQASYALSTGSSVISIGYLAGATTTDGPNIFIGNSAGAIGTSVNGNNVGIGSASCASLTSGAQNYIIGDNAFHYNTTGSYNVAMGYNNLGSSSNTAGTLNTAIGGRSLEATTGSNNTGLGYHSLNLNTSGASNLAMGYFAGKYTTTRSNQVYINSLDKTNDFNEQNLSLLYGQQNTAPLSQFASLNAKVGIYQIAPTAFLHLTRGRTVASSSPLKFAPNISLATTATAGSGGTATLTYASQTNMPFFVGDSIRVAGVTPAGYNGDYVVTAVTATTVQYASATTGAQTVAGTVSTPGTLMNTPEAGAMEYNGTDGYYLTTATGAKRRFVVAGTSGRSTAQTAAVASLATYTLGASDASYEVSANVLVTTSSAEAFTVTCAYTDEGNTARTQTMPFVLLAGTTAAAINFSQGAVPYEGIPIHLRVKASTTITIATTGTFTGCTYNAEAIIKQTQ